VIYLIKLTILSYSISEKTADIEKDINLFVEKAFRSWEHVNNFIKRYAIVKDHRVRISGSEKVDKITNEVLKQKYLYHYARKATSKQTTQSNVSFCQVKYLWRVNIWVKKGKGCLEVTKFNDHHVGHECHPLASKFIPIL